MKSLLTTIAALLMLLAATSYSRAAVAAVAAAPTLQAIAPPAIKYAAPLSNCTPTRAAIVAAPPCVQYQAVQPIVVHPAPTVTVAAAPKAFVAEIREKRPGIVGRLRAAATAPRRQVTRLRPAATGAAIVTPQVAPECVGAACK